MSSEKVKIQRATKKRLQTMLQSKGFDELAARKKAELEIVGDKKDAAKIVFTPYEALVVAIGETLAFFDAHEQRVIEL